MKRIKRTFDLSNLSMSEEEKQLLDDVLEKIEQGNDTIDINGTREQRIKIMTILEKMLEGRYFFVYRNCLLYVTELVYDEECEIVICELENDNIVGIKGEKLRQLGHFHIGSLNDFNDMVYLRKSEHGGVFEFRNNVKMRIRKIEDYQMLGVDYIEIS